MTTDVSKMYHKVRGQDTIKLYVIYNALEVSLSCPGLLTQLTGSTDCRQAMLGFWTRYSGYVVLQGNARGGMVE
jgi:hypothetical protein